MESNAAVQAGELANLWANAGAQSGSISSLTSNAAVQAGELANVTNGTATFTSINFVNGGRVADSPGASLLFAPTGGTAYVIAESANANIIHGYSIQSTTANISVHNATNAITHHWQFADTGNLTLPATGSVHGNVAFTMANTSHWTSNVYTTEEALNQLAERIWNIENP